MDGDLSGEVNGSGIAQASALEKLSEISGSEGSKAAVFVVTNEASSTSRKTGASIGKRGEFR